MAVYPRACGERALLVHIMESLNGLSPRLRGTERGEGLLAELDRFIPAPAGNGALARSSGRAPAVYPRACGERLMPF